MFDLLSKIDWLIEGFFTAVLVLGLTVYYDWRKEQRHFKNMTGMIFTELLRNYNLLELSKRMSFELPISFNTEVWDKVRFDFSRYADNKMFGSIDSLYNLFERVNITDPDVMKYSDYDPDFLIVALREVLAKMSKKMDKKITSFGFDQTVFLNKMEDKVEEFIQDGPFRRN